MKLGQIFFILNLQTALPDAAWRSAPPMKEIPANFLLPRIFLSHKNVKRKKNGTAACWGGSEIVLTNVKKIVS